MTTTFEYGKKVNVLEQANQAIRNALKECGMYQWQLAKLLSISEATLTRRMRTELSQEAQREIIARIHKWAK